jgi:hypothetical protein
MMAMRRAKLRLAWAWSRRECTRLVNYSGTDPRMTWFLAASTIAGMSMLCLPLFQARSSFVAVPVALGIGYLLGGIVVGLLCQPFGDNAGVEDEFLAAELIVARLAPFARDVRRRQLAAIARVTLSCWHLFANKFVLVALLMGIPPLCGFWSYAAEPISAFLGLTTATINEFYVQLVALLVAYEASVFATVCYLIIQACPRCGSWAGRRFITEKILSRNECLRTVYQAAQVFTKHDSGVVLYPQQVMMERITSDSSYQCRYCGHSWKERRTTEQQL